jgi:P pilus assembly chaperone PapD
MRSQLFRNTLIFWGTVGMLSWMGGCLTASRAQAQSISPLLVDLSHARRVAAITLTNPASQALVYQVHLKRWEQTHGRDVYIDLAGISDSHEIVVAPPILTVPAQGSAMVRVGLRRGLASMPRQQAYRLVFEPIVPSSSAAPSGVSFYFEHNLPLFVTADARPAPSTTTPTASSLRLSWGSAPRSVQVCNDEDRYIQLKAFTAEGHASSSKAITSSFSIGGSNGRILAHSCREYPVPTAISRVRTLSAQAGGISWTLTATPARR